MSTVAEWVAIVNLRSGGRRRPEAFARGLESAVSRVLVSERPGHVDELVRSCRDAEGILVAGGDGTLFEVLQACDRGRQKIVLLPSGRGNSLAKDLGVIGDCDPADCIRDGVDRAIDLLDVTTAHGDGTSWSGVSASNLAIGYPAAVAHHASDWRRFRVGSYAIAAMTAPLTRMRVRLNCDAGESESLHLTGLVISNSRYVGPFLGFPASDLCDGICHTVEMRVGRLRQTLHNLSSLSGLGFYEPLTRRDIRSIDVTLEEPALLKIDGELRENVREIHGRVRPGAVVFRVPAIQVARRTGRAADGSSRTHA
jgi:diacylglycerol kinase family enzyme